MPQKKSAKIVKSPAPGSSSDESSSDEVMSCCSILLIWLRDNPSWGFIIVFL